MTIDPDRLEGRSAYELLEAGAKGLIGLDRRWLRALLGEPAKTLPDIVRFANEDRSKDPISLEPDLIGIFHHWKAPEGLPFLMQVIRVEPLEVPDEVMEALEAIGAPAIEPLLRLYEDLPEEERSETVFLLAGLGVKDPRIQNTLLEFLDEDWESGLFYLEVYHDPELIPLLQERAEAAGAEARRDLEDTISKIQEPQEEVAFLPFDVWEPYPEKAGPEFRVLSTAERLEFLTQGTAWQRAAAANNFFDEDLTPQIEAQLLESARHDPSVEVRANCWRCFYGETESRPLLRQAMMDRLADPETPSLERGGLAVGLANHVDQAPVRQAILELVKDPATRVRAAEAMWRSFDQSFAEQAGEFLKDSDLNVVQEGIRMVGYFGLTELAPELEDFFHHEDLREEALHAYAMAAPGKTTVSRVRELMNRISDLANGFSDGEEELVEMALDVRLARAGLKPIYGAIDDGKHEPPPSPDPPQEPVRVQKVGRNEPCPCGSGKKYKKCCGQ